MVPPPPPAFFFWTRREGVQVIGQEMFLCEARGTSLKFRTFCWKAICQRVVCLKENVKERKYIVVFSRLARYCE